MNNPEPENRKREARRVALDIIGKPGSEVEAIILSALNNATLAPSVTQQEEKTQTLGEPDAPSDDVKATRQKKRLGLRPFREHDYPEDVARMKVALLKAGFTADSNLIRWAWAHWSENARCAGWYSINGVSEEFIVDKLLTVLQPVTEDIERTSVGRGNDAGAPPLSKTPSSSPSVSVSDETKALIRDIAGSEACIYGAESKCDTEACWGCRARKLAGVCCIPCEAIIALEKTEAASDSGEEKKSLGEPGAINT